MADFDFDGILPQERTMRFRGEDYVITEPSEAAHAAWRDSQVKGSRFSDEGKLESVGAIASSSAVLIAGCTFKIDKEGNRASVSADTIRSWPCQVTNLLYDWIMDVGGLKKKDDKNKEPGKNSQPATPAITA